LSKNEEKNVPIKVSEQARDNIKIASAENKMSMKDFIPFCVSFYKKMTKKLTPIRQQEQHKNLHETVKFLVDLYKRSKQENSES